MASNLHLIISSDRDSATRPDKFFPIVITLTVKNVCLISSLNFFGFRFYPLDFVIQDKRTNNFQIPFALLHTAI